MKSKQEKVLLNQMSEHESTPSTEAMLRNIAMVTTAVANGDLSQRIIAAADGDLLDLKNTINGMLDQLTVFTAEATRLALELGTEGIFGGQMEVKSVTGIWKELTGNLNVMAANLTDQVRNISHVVTAVASGDLTKKITVDGRGEVLALKDTTNVMVDQLNSLVSEVTRVARGLGTQGQLGRRVEMRGVAGTWRDLSDNINIMADSLTVQVRSLSDTVQAALEGDTTRRITVEAQGEMRGLRDRLNLLIERTTPPA